MADASAAQREEPASGFTQARNGMNAAEASYMRGGAKPVAGSVPMSTSRYLNSPLFVHAFSTMALRRTGPDLPPTYDIPTMSRALADVADHQETLAAIEEEKSRNPAFAAFLQKRPMTSYDPAQMTHHAPGTLGAEIRTFIEKTGYDLEFVNKGVSPRNDLEYLFKRFGDCHDIHHIVTGFGPNASGEHALAVMNVSCNARHFNPRLARALSMPNIFVSAASYTRIALHYHEGMPLHLDAMAQGIRAGLDIRIPLAIVEWENYLDWPVEEVAKDLGFARGPGDAWEITNTLCRG
jgi:ubiquinone biosynthesis protein Coq4